MKTKEKIKISIIILLGALIMGSCAMHPKCAAYAKSDKIEKAKAV